MSTKAGRMTQLDEPKKKRTPSRSPGRKPNGKQKAQSTPVQSYKSEGVGDYDIFSLPSSDWQLLVIITIIGASIRLWKITQPTSVVFDEVQ
jgi:dolichyl-phosphate-mannose-protein mannosyltransferase